MSLMNFEKEKDINKQFKFLATIGKGAYGSVVLVQSLIDLTDTEIYALKILKEQDRYGSKAEKDEHLKNLQTELEIMLALQGSPFIVKMYGNLYQKKTFYFIMEYINGGDLFFHIRKSRAFSLERSKFYAAELLLAIEFMHQNGVIYRDLKPENVLIDSEGHIKIIDFGLSNFKNRLAISNDGSMSGNELRASIFSNNIVS